MTTKVRSFGTSAGVRFTFRQDAEGVVWVTTPTRTLGGWRLERFGSSLGIAWARAWALEVFAGGLEVTA